MMDNKLDLLFWTVARSTGVWFLCVVYHSFHALRWWAVSRADIINGGKLGIISKHLGRNCFPTRYLAESIRIAP